MKRSHLILLIVLVGIAAYFFFTRTNSTITTEYSNFAYQDTSLINRIFIADYEGNTADLVRQGNNSWKINNKYKARQDAVDLILRSLKLIKVKEPVPDAAKENVIKQMAGRSLKAEFYTDDEAPVRVFYIGNPTQNHFGTYMLLELEGKKSSTPFITHIPGFHGFITARYFTEEDTWRDRTVFTFDGSDIAKVQIKYNQMPHKSFLLERMGDDFIVKNLSDLKSIPNQREDGFEEYLDRFKTIHFEYIQREATLANIDSVLATEAIHEIVLTDKEGKTEEVKTYFKPVKAADAINPATGEPYTYDIDRLYAWINEEDFVVMQWPTIDKILAYNSDFMKTEIVDN